MRHLLLSESALFRQEGAYTVLFANSMAAGFVTSAILFQLIRSTYRETTA